MRTCRFLRCLQVCSREHEVGAACVCVSLSAPESGLEKDSRVTASHRRRGVEVTAPLHRWGFSDFYIWKANRGPTILHFLSLSQTQQTHTHLLISEHHVLIWLCDIQCASGIRTPTYADETKGTMSQRPHTVAAGFDFSAQRRNC